MIVDQQQQQQMADQYSNGFHQSADNDNDEENIVIDMTDDDGEVDEAHEEYSSYGQFPQQQGYTSVYANHNNNIIDHKLKDQADDQQSIEGQSSPPLQQFNVGDLIWFDPNQYGYLIPGKIVDYYADLNVLTVEGHSQPAPSDEVNSDYQDKILLASDEQLQIHELNDLQQFKTIKPRLPLTEETGVSDLTYLRELSNESIIFNLKLRHKQELVYTKCGHKILISVNPFKQLCELYNLDQVNKFDTLNTSRLHTTAEADNNLPHGPQSHIGAQQSLLRWLLIHDGVRQNKASNEPHIFGIANEALKRLLISGQNQCFVLLGESGAGKTEACKLLIQYLATINKSPSNLMTEQILESVHLLDSFGNAKTNHNDNSSRYGKIFEICFNLSSSFITDAKIIDLNLLDRARIVSQGENERNYHIFYELLSGLSQREKEKYGLQSAEKYFYLNQGHCVELDSKEDDVDFQSLMSAMQVLGFNHEEQDTIFRLLASVLHLGNIYFHRKVLAVRSGKLAQQQQQNSGIIDEPAKPVAPAGVEGVEVGSDTEVRWVSHLLQIQFEQVMRCLTVRTTEATYMTNNGPRTQHNQQPHVVVDRIVSPLNIDQALDTRDAIARALYTCLFKWLVQRTNAMINANQQQNGEAHQSNCAMMNQNQQRQEPIYLCRTSESLCEFQPDKLQQHSSRSSSMTRTNDGFGASTSEATISILDAFGFENLSENNFEQLCINYTAELLHYHTSRYLLRLEQAEYLKERLRWTPIATPGAPESLYMGGHYGTGGSANSANGTKTAAAIVNLISKKPLGILAILDDECNFPKATDQSFAEKCHHNHTLNENYQCARLAASCQEFGVRHFRQSSRLVYYQVEGFVEKNRDALRPDILELLLGSKMSIVGDMLRKLHRSNTTDGASQKTLSRTHDGRYVSMKPRAATVAAKFQDTINNNRVMEALNYSASSLPAEVSYYSGPIGAKYLSNGEPSAFGDSQLRPNPWFVICLRASRSKSPQVFDVAYMQDQLRSLNLLELAQIRKTGYPIRISYGEFVRRYKCLVPSKFLNNLLCCQSIQAENQRILASKAGNKSAVGVKGREIKRAIRDVCRAIAEFRFGDQSQQSPIRGQYQCGLTKMFLNERLYEMLEQMRLLEHQRAIELLQRTFRMWPVRWDFLRQRQAAVLIQARVRGYLARQQFWRQYFLIINLQRHWRQAIQVRHRKAQEARRWAQKQQQQRQLQELQAQQRRQANQYRHRVQPGANASSNRTSLDIPDELARLYRKQRNWTPIHDSLAHLNEIDLSDLVERELKRQTKFGDSPNSVPFVVIGGNDPNDLKQESQRQRQRARPLDEQQDVNPLKVAQIVQEIELDERFSLQNFILKYFTIEAPQFGYSRLPITRPFSWQRTLTLRKHMEDSEAGRLKLEFLDSKAEAMYKLILRYIDSDQRPQSSGSKKSEESESIQRLLKFKLIADYIIYLCIKEPQLRNELYMQLASQAWQNPKPHSTENAWKLMLNCLSCFAPTESELCKFLLKYASDYCSSKYKILICNQLARELAGSSSLSDPTRKLPVSLLEYYANEKAATRLALAASCYMDDHAINGNQHLPAEDCPPEDLNVTNYSNRTLIEINSQTSAEQLALKLLKARKVPEANLAGWSVEVQHEGAHSEFSSRLRGDDRLLDHFARVELVPQFEQIMYNMIELSLATEKAQQQTNCCGDSSGEQHQQSISEGGRYIRRRRSMAEFSASSERNSRLSQASMISRGQRHQQYATSDVEDSMAPHAGRSSAANKLNRHHTGHMDGAPVEFPDDPRYDQDYLADASLNRRSISMQELQLASSSVLNGRYFQQGQPMVSPPYQQYPFPHPPPTRQHHYDSSYVSAGSANNSQRRRSRKNSVGSLVQLPPGPEHMMLPGRRRSQTPNSLATSSMGWQPHERQYRMSSSAYGSESRYSSSYATTVGYGDNIDHQHLPNRMRASHQDSGSKPGGPRHGHSDHAYSSAAEYESVGMGPSRMLRGRPGNPAVERYRQHANGPKQQIRSHRKLERLSPGQVMTAANHQQSASGHYATSSAMSDTSEAPSLASHVRGVKVPQHNGDMDKYLDDLFNPLLVDADLDELSDARSLATSIRGTMAEVDANLSSLCDPSALSKMIRGTDSEAQDEKKEAQKSRGLDEASRRRASTVLSPTFESLLKSLKGGSGSSDSPAQATDTVLSISGRPISSSELSQMDLNELRALNERLDSQIEAAKSDHASLERVLGESERTVEPPAPPPQPSFGPMDDAYSRAKTIRIGKWRWPPPAEASAPAAPETAEPLEQKVEEAKQADEAQIYQTAADQAQVGRLKISSEMKAKLEQLTTSSGGSSTGKSGTSIAANSGIVSQVKSQLISSESESKSSVSRLADQRKLLLQSQLLGATTALTLDSDDPQSRRVSSELGGSKVLAVKQQLAAAAGVALAALDSQSNRSSQASSRRQSGLVQAQMIPEGESRRLSSRAAQDELGPQSRVAINQRQAFYQMSVSTDQLHQEHRAPNLATAGSEVQLKRKDGELDVPIPPPMAISSDNLANRCEPLAPPLQRTMRMSSDLNEIGQSSPMGREGDRLCGQSIAKSLAQRQHESLIELGKERTGAADQWVSSLSPDPTLERLRRSKRISRQSQNDLPNKIAKRSAGAKETAGAGAMRLQAKTEAESTCLTYANVDWQVRVRKEFFLPSETYENSLVVQLIFAQLVADVFNPRQCARLNMKERAAIKLMMKDNSIGYAPSLPPIGQMQQVKRDLIRMARSFGLYFTRHYLAHNFALENARLINQEEARKLQLQRRRKRRSSLQSQQSSSSSDYEPEVEQEPYVGASSQALKLAKRLSAAKNLGTEWIDMVAIHHSGLRLVVVQQQQQPTATASDTQAGGPNPASLCPPVAGYKVLETLKYRDMTDVSQLGQRELLVSMRNGKKCWLISSDQVSVASVCAFAFVSQASHVSR